MKRRAESQLEIYESVSLWLPVGPLKYPLQTDQFLYLHLTSRARLIRRPDGGGSTHLWNVGPLQRSYTAQYSTRLSSSYSSPWEPEISHTRRFHIFKPELYRDSNGTFTAYPCLFHIYWEFLVPSVRCHCRCVLETLSSVILAASVFYFPICSALCCSWYIPISQSWALYCITNYYLYERRKYMANECQ
jgi:hypothetical protein